MTIALALLLTTLSAQQPVFTEPAVNVTAIELVADVRDSKGQVPSDLRPEDFVLLEDGVEKPIIGVDYMAPRPLPAKRDLPVPAEVAPTQADAWQIVIYVDAFFSDPLNLRNATDSLARQAEELAALGTVEIVAVDVKPSLILKASRDPEAIRAGLKTAGGRGGMDWLARHRRRYIAERDIALRAGIVPIGPYVAEEIVAIVKFRRSLVEWVSQYPRHVPRALLVVSGGFELDPTSFYRSYATVSAEAARITQEVAQYQMGSLAEGIGRTLSAASWTTISVEAPLGGAQFVNDASRDGIGRTYEVPRGATFTSLHARDPLLALAEATGGAVVTRGNLAKSIAGLGERVKITYQVSRPPDGRAHRVELRPKRAGLTVQTFRWSAEATSEEIAAARAVKLTRGGGEAEGDLPVTVAVDWAPAAKDRRSGTITVRAPLVSVAPLLRDGRGVFRVTIAVNDETAHAVVIHRTVADYDASSGTFVYRAPIEVGPEKIVVAVAVEELTTGIWGGGRAGVK